MSVQKNFSAIGPAVWPAIHDIYKNVLFYYIDSNMKTTPRKQYCYSFNCA